MAETENASKPAIKIKRTRKRLYDPVLPEEEATKPAVERIFSESVSEEAKKADAKTIVLGIYASEIIKEHVLWSAGLALIPAPLVDLVAVTVIQLRMLKQLCDHYGVEFSEHRGKALIASLIGGLHTGLLATSLLRAVPIFGLVVAIVPTAAAAGAITYAVGKVFVQHFETGGTLLDFDPSKVRKLFAEKYREGQLTPLEK
jgi:uncharacterized protein (DUF697 family)